MKNLTLLAITAISLYAAPSLEAQESKSPWTFGVKAGINLSTFDVDKVAPFEEKNTDGITGFNAGVTVEYSLRNRFFLASGLEYSNKGADYSKSSSTQYTAQDGKTYNIYTLAVDSRRINYLQLPLTAGYRLPVQKDMNITFNIGGYFGVNVFGKGKYDKAQRVLAFAVDELTHGSEELEKLNYYTQTTASKTGDIDYGLIGGVGFEYKKLSLNANYEFGLCNIHTAEPKGDEEIGAWKNRNLVLSVGYKF